MNKKTSPSNLTEKNPTNVEQNAPPAEQESSRMVQLPFLAYCCAAGAIVSPRGFIEYLGNYGYSTNLEKREVEVSWETSEGSKFNIKIRLPETITAEQVLS